MSEPRELGAPAWPVNESELVTGDGEAAAGPARSVLVVGDSITDSAARPVTAELARRGWSATISARPGDMVRDRLDPASIAADRHPAAVAINLGTNDGSCVLANVFGTEPCRVPSFTFDDMRADADALLAVFPPDTCIVTIEPTFGEEINRHWERRAREGRLAAMRSWRRETDARPDYLLDALGHLSPAGQVAYGRFVAQVVDEACGSAADPVSPGKTVSSAN